MVLCSALLFFLVFVGTSGVARPDPDVNINVNININGEPASGGSGEEPDKTIEEPPSACWSDIHLKHIDHGTQGPYNCKIYICNDGEWEETGVVDNCTSGCWSDHHFKPLEHGTQAPYNCTIYTCLDGEWEETGVVDNCTGCWSDEDSMHLDHGTEGPYNCKIYTCLDGEWEETGVVDNCTSGCWSDELSMLLDHGTEGPYNCKIYTCLDGEWEETGVVDNCTSATCLFPLSGDAVSQDTKGYYKCKEIQCQEGGIWRPTGETLSGCIATEDGINLCYDPVKNESVDLGSELNWDCFTYTCGVNDWEKTGALEC